MKQKIHSVHKFSGGSVALLRKMHKAGELVFEYDRDHHSLYGVKIYNARDASGRLRGMFWFGVHIPNQWQHVKDFYNQASYEQKQAIWGKKH